MTLNRRKTLLCLLSAPLLAMAPVAGAQSATQAAAPARPATAAAAPDEQTITEAYVYLLGRMLVIRQERNDLKEPGIGYNVIKYNPRGSADFVNPNLDVAYLEAWFAVDDKTPVILDVPEIRNRYYTAQILDEWGEVIVNINERNFPSKPFGRFALVKAGTNPKIPADAARIELHGSKAKMLARVELKDDPDGAMALQKKFRLETTGKPKITPALTIPDFNNKDLLGVEIFDNVDRVFGSALDVSPVAAEMQQKVRYVAAYVAANPAARASTDKLLREKVVPEFKEYAFTQSAPYRNHWIGGGQTGNYGSNYRVRTVVNYAGIWGNAPKEVVYFVATRDANEKTLNGSNSYVVAFPAGQLPDTVVDAYWSIILVGVPDYRVMPNAFNRFNLNSHSPLKKEADGSLKIAIGPKPVAGVPESNWLPSAEGKPFSLTFRTYVPKDAVTKGQWSPPAVTPAR